MQQQEGWEAAEAELTKQSGGDYLRLQPGETASVVFVSEPCIRKTHWVKGQPTECKSSDECPFSPCLGDKAPKIKYQFNVWSMKDRAQRKFELGAHAFRAVARQRKRLGDTRFAGAIFDVFREGAGPSTQWHIDYNRQLSEEELESMKKQNLADVPF